MAAQDDSLVGTPTRRREFLAFIKNLRSFKGDLSAFTAPPFLLSGTSMTEYPLYWLEQPQLLAAPATEDDPLQRAVEVLKWYICTLKQQYGKRDGRKKKPLNPFLGELFLGHFQDSTGKMELVAEQVSHHPPVTAYHAWNEEKGIHLHGYNAQKTFFSGTINIHKIGFVLLRLDKYNEEYLVTLPKMHLEGLFPPPPYPELEGTTYIQSSTGYTSKIEYSGKGWIRGKKNSFTATMYKTDTPEKPLRLVEGQWQYGVSEVKHMPSKKHMDSFSTEHYPLSSLNTAPIDEQDPLESRRAWQKVAQAIEKGDMAAVGLEKTKIEEEQRALRKTEKIEGTEWQTRYFTKVNSWPVLEKLVELVGVDLELDATKGMWKWDEEKYARLKTSA